MSLRTRTFAPFSTRPRSFCARSRTSEGSTGSSLSGAVAAKRSSSVTTSERRRRPDRASAIFTRIASRSAGGLLAAGREDPLHRDERLREADEERAHLAPELHPELGDRLLLAAVDLDLEGRRVHARLPDRPDDLRPASGRGRTAPRPRRGPRRPRPGSRRSGRLPGTGRARNASSRRPASWPRSTASKSSMTRRPSRAVPLGAEEPPRHRVRAPHEARGVGEDDAERERLGEARPARARRGGDRARRSARSTPRTAGRRRGRGLVDRRREASSGARPFFRMTEAGPILSAGNACESRARSFSSVMSPSPRSARSRRESRSSSRFGGGGPLSRGHDNPER